MSDIATLEDLIRRGHFAQARTQAQELLITRNELRVKQIYALALSRSGVPEAAREYLEKVSQEHPDDPETNGILGGIYKELFKKNQSSTFAILARDTYERNFKLTKNYYTGINAATMSTLAGQARRGKEIAQEVLDSLTNPDGDFWEAATQGEAFLLLKDRSKSEAAYLKARKLAMSHWGKISTVYNQLWLLKHYLPVPGEAIRAFSPPVVISFIGHMIDHQGRPLPRFPASIEPQVKQAISSAINSINGKIGYCSLACGGDILFAEAMEEAGGELNLFLPCVKEDFIEASVSFAGDEWVQRFNRLVAKYPVTYLTQEPYEEHADLFLLQTSVIFGLSFLRGMRNHQEPFLLSVLSERDQQKRLGGTRDTIALWPNPKNHISINPDVFISDLPQPANSITESISVNRTDRPVVYFVCTDVSPEEKLNIALKKAMEESSLPPLIAEVTEDHFIAGFKTIFSAMEFCDLAGKSLLRSFQQKNLMRISLHVSPHPVSAASMYHPLKESLTDKLLKLHALTAPGAIYATGIFAAILSLANKRYQYDYIDTLATDGIAKALDVYQVHTRNAG
jgi:hypothetical protein